MSLRQGETPGVTPGCFAAPNTRRFDRRGAARTRNAERFGSQQDFHSVNVARGSFDSAI